eukprot:m51a1_g2162 putative protein kinase domain containing protein (860) ;mRNA; f:41982-45209
MSLFSGKFDAAKFCNTSRAALEQITALRGRIAASLVQRSAVIDELKAGREPQAKAKARPARPAPALARAPDPPRDGAEQVLKQEAEALILNYVETTLRDLITKQSNLNTKKCPEDLVEPLAGVCWAAPRFSYATGVPAMTTLRDQVLDKWKKHVLPRVQVPQPLANIQEGDVAAQALVRTLAQANNIRVGSFISTTTGGLSLSAGGQKTATAMTVTSLTGSLNPKSSAGSSTAAAAAVDIIAPPEGSIRVELRALPLQIADGLPLSFDLGSGQAPVDKDLRARMVLKNESHEKRTWRMGFTEEHTPRKYALSFEPSSGQLQSGKSVAVDVTLRVLCTAHLEVYATMLVSSKDETVYADLLFLRADSQLSTRLDRDEVVCLSDPIGSGAFGTVYRGTYRGLDVAIKVLSNQDVSPMLADDFRAEVAIMEKLRHPCILNFVGATHDSGAFSIVTEFCGHGNLWSALKKNKFSYSMKLKCLVDCANAMNFLHQSGILHRDLKPENLLVVSLEARSAVVCKLSDFGTTRDLNQFAKDMNCTKGIGTPLYMAPEILDGAKYEHIADVYSFGLMMYVVYAEQTPFEGELVGHPWEFSAAIRKGKRPDIPAGCPANYVQLMTRCWAADPSSRPRFNEICTTLSEMLAESFGEAPATPSAVPVAASPNGALPQNPSSSCLTSTVSAASSSVPDIMPGEIMKITDRVVIFEYCYLSQWYPAMFSIKDCKYNCCEQYTQAEKARMFNDSETLQQIMATDDASRMRYLGRCVKNYDDSAWKARIRDVSMEANLAKFRQNQTLRERLMRTGMRQIGEAVADENVWGIGLGMHDPDSEDPTRWQGQNMLGRNIMNVRAMLSRGVGINAQQHH